MRCATCEESTNQECSRCGRPLCLRHMPVGRLCRSCQRSPLRRVEGGAFLTLWGGAVAAGFAASLAGLGLLIVPITLSPVVAGALYRRTFKKTRKRRGFLADDTPRLSAPNRIGNLGLPPKGPTNGPND